MHNLLSFSLPCSNPYARRNPITDAASICALFAFVSVGKPLRHAYPYKRKEEFADIVCLRYTDLGFSFYRIHQLLIFTC